MLLNYLLRDEYLWFIPLVLQGISYFLLFPKLGIAPLWGFIPGGADWKLSGKLFRDRRAFWRAFLTSSYLIAMALYLNPSAGSGMVTARIFRFLAFTLYELYLFRMYRRLGKSFGRGKGILFGIAAALLPPLVLTLLALNKRAQFRAPVFKPYKQHGPILTFLGRFSFIALSLVEAAIVIVAVGFITIRSYPPAFIVDQLQNEMQEKTKDVTGTGTVITPQDTMGEAAANLATMPTSREKFFPDHSQDQSVVVMEYVVGSDLEDRAGLASANITQMIEATKQGSGLTFALEIGGSQRWFTKGIDEASYGRYTVRDGKLEKVEALGEDTCMSESQTLADFIAWAKENYPADRYMLVLWDHGGGLSSGCGYDIINKKKAHDDSPMLNMSDIADAIAQNDIKFDVIGFDACLMQDIEVAVALEPYADYFLASEEVEGGFGWFYTTGFGMLAKDPSIPTEDFGREIVACYDPYNTIIKDEDGKPDTTATLSFVDLPLAKAAYQKMEGFFADARKAVRADSTSFANLSLAGTKSYMFQNNEQVDLIDFLNNLERLDYEDKICSDDERNDIINAVKACVLYRNGNSAEGVNGMALTFPVETTEVYTYDYRQLKHFTLSKQQRLYNDFFSIIAAQRKKEAEDFDPDNASFVEVLAHEAASDPTDEEWYVKGFEDYEQQPALIDIPLQEVEGGYQIQVPDGVWDIVANQQLIAYQKADGGLLRYLGTDSLGATDANGHPMVAMDGTWVHVGGKLVSYEGDEPRVTKDGTVFNGTVKARLNGDTDIKLYIEWDPVSEEGEAPASGHVVGYTLQSFDELAEVLGGLLEDETLQNLATRGKEQLKAGDKVEFLFDYYDEEGNVAKTEAYGGALRVSNMGRITVEDAPIESSDVVFGGVLTDVYQRVMTTEKIEAHTGA